MQALLHAELNVFCVGASARRSSRTTATLAHLLRGSHRLRDILALGVSAGGDLDPTVPPCVLPRGDVILVALGPVRALVHTDCAYVLGAGATGEVVADAVASVVSDLREDDAPLPFELRFLEATLEEVCRTVRRQVNLLSRVATQLSRQLQVAGSHEMPDLVAKIQPMLEKLESLRVEIEQLDRCLNDLLQSDEDMTSLLLTALQKGITPGPDDHNVVELMVEAYHRNLHHTALRLELVIRNVLFGRRVADMKLAIHRNRLLRTNVQIAISSVSVAMCGAVASMWGMNIPVPFQHQEALVEGAFAGVVGFSTVAAVSFYTLMWAKATGMGDSRGEARCVQTAVACHSMLAELETVEKLFRGPGRSASPDSFRNQLSDMLERPVAEEEVDWIFDATQPGLGKDPGRTVVT